jgi:hypothetical protein
MLEQEKHNTTAASLNAALPAMMKTLDYEYTKGTTGRWFESMGCMHALCTFATLRYATVRFATLRYASLRGTPGDFGGLRFFTCFSTVDFASLPFLLRVFLQYWYFA